MCVLMFFPISDSPTDSTVTLDLVSSSTSFASENSQTSWKKNTDILLVSAHSHLLRLKGPSEQQQRMAAVETDKELNDLLDFSAVRSPLKIA